jgi:hypothetical protein
MKPQKSPINKSQSMRHLHKSKKPSLLSVFTKLLNLAAFGSSTLIEVTSMAATFGGFAWLTESGIGATSYMTASREAFSDYQLLPTPTIVSLTDKTVTTGIARGSVLINTLVQGTFHVVTLYNVLHVPKLGRNLFSIPRSTSRGNSFSGNKTAINFFVPTGENILVRHRFGDLYYILLSIAYAESANATMKENIWHLRLGHPGVQPLCDLAKSGTV